MLIMTNLGPVSCDTFHAAINADIKVKDAGLDTEMMPMGWGSLITITRQTHSTKWRIWAYQDGTSRLTHLQTPTLPAVDMRFEHGKHLELRDAVFYFIERGWI